MSGSVLVVHPYWSFWESSVPGDLREDRARLLAEATDVLAEHVEVVRSVLIDDPAGAAAALDGLPPVDAVVVVASMAVPPATGMAAVDRVPGVPVVVWAVSRRQTLREAFSHSDVTTEGSTVGGPMIGSALARSGRPFSVVASTLVEPGGIGAEVRAAVAAGRIGRARLLRIGSPIPGYTTVVPPDGVRALPGLEVVDVPPTEFSGRVRDVSRGAVRQVVDAIAVDGVLAPDVDPEGLARAAAAEVVLRELVASEGCAAGMINCHDPALRPSADFGIAPCLALGRLTSEGIPFTCTGDALTAIAMLAVQALGRPSLYHEVEALDHERDEAILANSGEHDRRLCPDPRMEVAPNVWYAHDPITAPCALFTVGPGPASLVAFVFAPEPLFVVAEGSFTGRRSPATGTVNAGFRFGSGPVGEAWARWAAAGVTHHSAATDAHIADDVARVARLLGVECLRV
jgi:L-arabinose isomerase